MDYTLLVTPEEMISTAQECETVGTNISNTMTQIKSVVDGLRSVHEGDSATAYNMQFHKLDGDVETMNQRIHKHVDELQEIANLFLTEEKRNVDETAGLPKGVFGA